MKLSKKNKIKLLEIVLIAIIIFLVVSICILVGMKLERQKNQIELNLYSPTDDVYVSAEKQLEDVAIPNSYHFSIPIFMYHFITDDYGENKDVENFLSPVKLEEQVKYIKENGYQTVYASELDTLYKYSKPVCLTFDDCFKYFYDNAFPILKKYNQKASIFIITDYIDGPNYLTTEQLKEIAASGIIEIESHSLTHPLLATLTEQKMKEEVVLSKQALRDKLGVKSTVFAYPSGNHNEKTVKQVKENYKLALNMLGGVYYSNKHNGYTIPRIYANRSMSMKEYIGYLAKSNVTCNY